MKPSRSGYLSFSHNGALRRPGAAPFLLCCIMVVALLSLASCENDLSKLPGKNNLKDLDNDRASDVTFVYSEEGKVKAKLYTKEFIGNENARPPYIDFLKGVKMDMFDDKLQVESTITARTARYYTRDENVIARDSVVVINRKGEKLQTEELIWNKKLERFYTDKFVRITKDDQISYGSGLEATQDLTYVKIKNQRGTIPVANSDFPSE
ncbi:LPS export ABC transporter periplasmic protein LptC [Taibaiella koreensis]|uniref:LPS export ABC transporter periplasmic protein LptC n=1 Tax=Taibaiella koreensis TaxID=1268548 RepID=UPI000E59FEA3|nr:LPS export ABC transporter periplasmic protein LptC [Taibaiella koreensis]